MQCYRKQMGMSIILERFKGFLNKIQTRAIEERYTVIFLVICHLSLDLNYYLLPYFNIILTYQHTLKYILFYHCILAATQL